MHYAAVFFNIHNAHDFSLCLLKTLQHWYPTILDHVFEATTVSGSSLIPRDIQDAAFGLGPGVACVDFFQICHDLWTSKHDSSGAIYGNVAGQAAEQEAMKENEKDEELYKSILMERLIFQAHKHDLESPKGFNLYMNHVQEWRRQGRLPFLEPSVVAKRLHVESSDDFLAEATFDEVALFA
eukprot:Gregarina_sp_Poly_1__9785@NODE_624_length_7087_cov_45_976353_g478_i0_p5_GENE_NODE_624_length_7087_cov_45_976353_g478_i0NODE_624_length_7087_cov_45_976353_g478_i0_p5_ORF_typecomplete_len182_score27_41_NODE_624_length_7087_cov_45_976353_g478_i056236168